MIFNRHDAFINDKFINLLQMGKCSSSKMNQLKNLAADLRKFSVSMVSIGPHGKTRRSRLFNFPAMNLPSGEKKQS